MNRKKLSIICVGLVGLMILLNSSVIFVKADSIHTNFTEWTLTTETDNNGFKEIDGVEANNYRNYYQIRQDLIPYTVIDDAYTVQECVNYASTNKVNYAFTQTYMETENNDTFLADIGHFDGVWTNKSDFDGMYDNSDASCYTGNWDSLYSRENILLLRDSNNAGRCVSGDYFQDIINGSFEFWIITNNNEKATYLTLQYDTTTAIEISIDNGNLRYNDGSWNDINIITSNLWYHLRMDFSCTDNKYDFYINNEIVLTDVNYLNSVGLLNEFCFKTDISDDDYDSYVDAIGIYYTNHSYQPIPTEYYGNYTFANGTQYEAYNATYSWENQELFYDDCADDWTRQDNGAGNNEIDCLYETDNHSKIIHFYDYDSSSVFMYQDISIAQENGMIEFYWRAVDATKNSYIYCYEGEGITLALAINFGLKGLNNNEWYHFTIDFDCSSDTYDFYINDVLIDNDVAFNNVVDDITRIMFATTGTQSTEFYIDAIDYSWDDGYYLNRNQDLETFEWNDDFPFNWSSDFTSQISIVDYQNHENVVKIVDNSGTDYIGLNNEIYQTMGTVEFYINLAQTTQSAFACIYQSGTSNQIYFQAYSDGYFRYYDGSYHNIMTYSAHQWYHMRIEFDVNDDWHLWVDGVSKDGGSGYNFRGSPSYFNVVDFFGGGVDTPTFYIDSVDYSWCVDYYTNRNMDYDVEYTGNSDYQLNDNLEPIEYTHNAMTILEQQLGFYDGVNPIWSLNFEFWITMTNVYVVISQYEWASGWEYRGSIYDQDIYGYKIIDDYNEIFSRGNSRDNLEIQLHAYYGISNTGIEGINYNIKIFINKNNTACYDYENYYETSGTTIALEKYEFKRYGVAGFCQYNYYPNILRGTRFLKDSVNDYDSFMDFPLFDGKIITRPPPEPISPSKPAYNYWIYASYSLDYWYNDTIIVGELETPFYTIEVKAETSYFYYKLLDASGAGNWGVFGGWNWLRDALIWVVNILIFIPVQFLMYCLTVAFNFLIMFLIVGLIAVFIWNFLVKSIVWLGMIILWALWLLFMVLWAALQTLYETVLVPFFTWLLETGIPLIVNVLIVIWSVVLASFIWLLSLGTADYTEIFNTLVDLMTQISEYIVEIIVHFITHLPEILLYSFAYIMLVFFVYLKYMYAKARGYRKRAESLYQSYQTYLIPIHAVQKGVKGVIETIPIL